jgi:hypothetical protein
MRDRYIRASELKSFDFCQRAWHFERSGAPSTVREERLAGQREHREHAGKVAATRTASRFAGILFCGGVAGLVVGIAWRVIHP